MQLLGRLEQRLSLTALVICGRRLLTVFSRFRRSNMAPGSPRLAMEPQRPSQVTWRGDLTPPVTSYASAVAKTPLLSQNRIAPTTNRTNSAVVQRRPRREGLKYFYSYGTVPMPLAGVPRPGAGGVFSSSFQPLLTTLHDWVTNTAWFAAGYPRNLGLSTRVSQLQTKRTGGPTDASMDAKPIFPKVQRVQRYSVTPSYYPTRSANG